MGPVARTRHTALVTAFIDTATAERSPDLPRLGNPGYGDWPGPGPSTLALSRKSARTSRSGNVSSFVPVPAR
jgi:hypothetical protein